MTTTGLGVCPGGTGEKIRSCKCCRDIAADIEKVQRAIDGEQRLAAKNMLASLLKKHPDRPSLLAMNVRALLDLRDVEGAAASSDRFLEVHPQNAVAVSQGALVAGLRQDFDRAEELLQRGLALAGDTVPYELYLAANALAIRFVTEENYLAAIVHLLLQCSLYPEGAERAQEILQTIRRDPDVSLMLRQQTLFSKRPADAAWGKTFDAALFYAARGRWLEALQIMESLRQQNPGEPSIVRNQAILRAMLGRRVEARDGFREFASLPGVDEHDAVEAEAMAFAIGPFEDDVEQVELTYDVEELQSLLEKIPGDERINPFVPEKSEDDSPPPKAAFGFLDRLPPHEQGEVSLDALPRSLGSALLFGRQTDRPPQVVVTAASDAAAQQIVALINERTGGALSGEPKREVLGSVARVSEALHERYALSAELDYRKRAELRDASWDAALLQRLPATPLTELGGKTPAEAAKDPSLAKRVQGLILWVESTAAHPRDIATCDRLRQQLGLPAPTTLSAEGLDLSRLCPVYYPRLPFSQLSDQEIVELYEHVQALGGGPAAIELAREMAKRPSLDDAPAKTHALTRAALSMIESEEADQFLAQAKEVGLKRGVKEGVWLLQEAQLALARGDEARVSQIFGEVEARHLSDPQVAAMYQNLLQALLYRMASQDPERFEQAMQGMQGMGGMAAGGAGAEVPASAASGLWTPDQPTSAGAEKSSGSGLWLPGMD